MRLLRVVSMLALAALTAVVAGCGGTRATGAVPGSAELAPADAIGFVTIVSDESSEQWQRADRLLALFPGARESVVSGLERELSEEGLSWSRDVAPALGAEVVVVVTADRKPIALTQPDDAGALRALLQKSDEPAVSVEVSGWTAIAETQAQLDAYRAALERGTLTEADRFRAAVEALPSDALVRGWADLSSVTKDVSDALEGAGQLGDLGVEDLAVALSAEEDGVLLSLGVRAPDGTGSSSYEPELLDRVPADAVAAISFGGTQGTLDRVQRAIDLDGIAAAVDDAIGVSLESVFDAFSGEGVIYLREGSGELPEVTLVLDPPDADETWATIEQVARSVAQQAGGRIEAGTQSGLTVNRLELEGVKVLYARLDAETMLVTTGADGLDRFLEEGSKLTAEAAFRTAADRVGLGERTNGFAYVDLDGLIPFVEGLAGSESIPGEAREVLEALDSFILQTSADGDTARLSGFVRIPG